MFAKLAFRNVKRQIGNYLIYFMTVSLTVALMFAINNVIFSEQLLAYAEIIREMKSGLITISVLIALIVAFVLGYATSFMLKLRKREFGTYLTLGMTRRNILAIFLQETLLLCAAALGLGIFLGFLLYQGMMMAMTNLMEMEFAFAAYSAKGLILTMGLVCGVFLLSSVTSAFYLKKVSIYNLIHGEKMVEKKVRHPVSWFLLTVLSFAAIVGSCIVFYREVTNVFQSDAASAGGIFGSLTVLAAGTILFHIGLARSITNLLLKNRRFCSRGTNTFLLRQLAGKLRANSVMAGILAFLIAFAVIGANCSFVQKVSERVSLNRLYPFDINVNLNPENEERIDLAEAEGIIRQYAEIEKMIPYRLFTSGNGYLHGFTKWTGEGYEGLYDTFIRESDFNRLRTALGQQTVQLNGNFLICVNYNVPQILQYDFSHAVLTQNGKTYPFAGFVTDVPMFAYIYFYAIVPDDAIEGLSVEYDCAAYDLKDDTFDAQGLRSALTYSYRTDTQTHTYQRCDYHIREYGRIQSNSTSAILVIGALYIAAVFVFMAMAILALKTLAGLSEDRQRYGILFRLGAGEPEQAKTLFRQTFCFFFLPFAVPMLLSIPTAIICAQIMKFGGFAAQQQEVYLTAGIIALVLAVIYVLYFTAAYLIAKRNILPAQR